MTSEELEKAIEVLLQGQVELREQVAKTEAQVAKTEAQVALTEAQVAETEVQVAKTEMQMAKTQLQMEKNEAQTQIRFEETNNIMRMHGETMAEFSAIVLRHIEDQREINTNFFREMRDLRYDQSDLWKWHDKMRGELDEMSVMLKNLLTLKSRNGNSGNE